jgi:hypothetical protein
MAETNVCCTSRFNKSKPARFDSYQIKLRTLEQPLLKLSIGFNTCPFCLSFCGNFLPAYVCHKIDIQSWCHDIEHVDIQLNDMTKNDIQLNDAQHGILKYVILVRTF